MKINFKAYCKAGNKTKKGSPIYIYINIGGKKYWYSLNKHIDPKYFDNNSGRVLPGHPNSFKLNSLITNKLVDINNIVLDLEVKKRPVSYEAIIQKLESANPDSFISYLRSCLKSDRGVISENTYRSYKRGIDLFEQFSPQITFSEVGYMTINRFENWILNKTNNKSSNSSYQVHAPIRKYSKYAFREKLIDEYPYDGFKFKVRTAKEKEFLTIEERDKLYVYFIEGNATSEIKREVGNYLFSTFTGIARDDLLKPDGHITFEDNSISYRRGKTGSSIKVKLVSKAKELVQFVKLNKPFPSNTHGKKMLNSGLKLAGINKEITYHTARNTFAITSLQKGVNIRAVQKVLGHKSVATTEIYQRIADNWLDSEMDKLED